MGKKMKMFLKISAVIAIIMVGIIIVKGIELYNLSNKVAEATKRENLTLEEYVAYTIMDTLGTTTNSDKDRVRGCYIEDDGYVTVEINDEVNLTEKMTAKSFCYGTINVMKELSKDKEFLKNKGIRFLYVLDFVNSYGETKEGLACQIDIDIDTVKRAKWDKITIDNLKEISQKYWIHDALKEKE